MSDILDIVFNINPLGLEGLGATLVSLIRNCSNNSGLKLWFLCSELKEDDKANISNLIHTENFTGKTEYIDFDAKKLFGHLRSLHGDWTTYGRLLISNYISSDIAVYLDSDLIIMIDILKIKLFFNEKKLLSAVYGCEIKYSLDNAFFIRELKWGPDQKYFNAGILLLNLKRWRDMNTDYQWKSIANSYPNELISHDQTLLNALCEGDFTHLPYEFNNAWNPGSTRPEHPGPSIIHFVGSPKPWDFLGSIIHQGYNTWNSYNSNQWNIKYNKFNINKLKRFWKIKNSIIRNLYKAIISIPR